MLNTSKTNNFRFWFQS